MNFDFQLVQNMWKCLTWVLIEKLHRRHDFGFGILRENKIQLKCFANYLSCSNSPFCSLKGINFWIVNPSKLIWISSQKSYHMQNSPKICKNFVFLLNLGTCPKSKNTLWVHFNFKRIIWQVWETKFVLW